MNIPKAKAWIEQELILLRGAPMLNNGAMLPEWQEQIEIYTTCLEAFEQLEQMTHYHDRLQDWDRGMTEMLKAAIAGQETLQKELATYKAMVGE